MVFCFFIILDRQNTLSNFLTDYVLLTAIDSSSKKKGGIQRLSKYEDRKLGVNGDCTLVYKRIIMVELGGYRA